MNLVFRTLTGAATLTCSAVAAVCDRQVLLARICRTVLLHPCGGKTAGVHRTPLQKLWYRRATVPVAEDLRPRWPRANLPKGARVHARRNNTALNTAISPFPLVCHFHTPKRPQTSPSPRQSLRPRWPRSNLPRRATVPGRRRPAANMAARHSTITVAWTSRPDPSAMSPYPKKFRCVGRANRSRGWLGSLATLEQVKARFEHFAHKRTDIGFI